MTSATRRSATWEDAIRCWFQQAAGRGWLDDMTDAQRADFLNFEGNAQGFRVLTQLEYHQFDGGTRLTYATLGTYLKYPWTSRHAEALGYKKHKFGCYQNELPLLEQIAHKLNLPKVADQRWGATPRVSDGGRGRHLLRADRPRRWPRNGAARVRGGRGIAAGAGWRRHSGNLSPTRPRRLQAPQAGDPARQGHRAPDQCRCRCVRRTAE